MKHIMTAAVILLISLNSLADSGVYFSGELDASFEMKNLPTGKRGYSKFNIQSLFLDADIPLTSHNQAHLRVEGSEFRGDDTQRFNLRLREGYFDLVSVFKSFKALRVGLIPQLWQELAYENYNYRFLGMTGWHMTEKWNYLAYSDLGFSLMSDFPLVAGEWAFSLTNGERVDDDVKEKAYKELSLFVSFFKDSKFRMAANVVYGNYDTYESSINSKERYQLKMDYDFSDYWLGSLELLYAKDPAQALEDYKMADLPKLTSVLGTRVEAYAASLYSTIKLNSKSELLLRYDYLNAASQVKGKVLQSGILAYSYLIDEGIRAALAVDYTEYGKDYGIGVRDASKITLATQVLF